MSARLTDEELDALRSRKSDAITQVINTYTEILMSAAWGLGWTGTEAEELVQETFVAFLKSVERFEGRSSLKTYLFGILYNKSLERLRAKSRETTVDPVDEVFENRFGFAGAWANAPRGPEDLAQANETSELINACLASLTPAQRMAFYLREVEHATTEAICNALDVTVTHLGVLLFRARNKIRECIQKKWQEQSSTR